MQQFSRPIQVALLEDDVTCTTRFERAIAQSPSMQLVAAFGTAANAIIWLSQHTPDILLCDLGLPDHSGLDVIQFCSTNNPTTKVLVITLYEDESHVVRSLEAGASGYLLKDSLGAEIAEHITEVMQGGAPITPIIARYLLKKFQTPKLTPPVIDDDKAKLSQRELEILTRISQGFSYAEIAAQTSLSWHTVHTHIKKIYEKLAVHSRCEAVHEARQLGLLATHQ